MDALPQIVIPLSSLGAQLRRQMTSSQFLDDKNRKTALIESKLGMMPPQAYS